MSGRSIRWMIIAVAILLLVLFVVPMFVPWTPLNCRHQDVDIATGRLRSTRYLLYCKVSERIEGSPISNVLPKDMVDSATPDWHRVNTFSPGVHHSPHYIFHSAIHQIHMLDLLWSSLEPPPDVKRQMALHVLALWQHSRTDSIADNYIDWFWRQGPEIEQPGERQKAIFDRLLSLRITTQQEANGVTRFAAFYPDGTTMDEFEAYLNAKGDRVRHGVWTTWHSATSGEQAVFKDWKLVGEWRHVTRTQNQAPEDTSLRAGPQR